MSQNKLPEELNRELWVHLESWDAYVWNLRIALLEKPEYQETALTSLRWWLKPGQVIAIINSKIAIINSLWDDEELKELYHDLESVNTEINQEREIINFIKKLSNNPEVIYELFTFYSCSETFHSLPYPNEDDNHDYWRRTLKSLNELFDRRIDLVWMQELKELVNNNPMIRLVVIRLLEISLIQVDEIIIEVKKQLLLISLIWDDKELLKYYKQELQNKDYKYSKNIIEKVLQIKNLAKWNTGIFGAIRDYIIKKWEMQLQEAASKL